jgi:hypothetical protein
MDERECEEDHRRVLTTVAGLPFLDAIAELYEYNHHRRTFGPPPKCDAISEAEQFPDKSWDEVAAAITRVRLLYEEAAKMSDEKWGLPEETQVRAIGAFMRAHSEFSERTLSGALSYGAFHAMW